MEKSGPQEKLPVQKYEEDQGISGEEKDVVLEEDCEDGTSEEDTVEQGLTHLMDAESELFMEFKRDRHNTPICKLVPATASDLQWNHFMGQSTRRK